MEYMQITTAEIIHISTGPEFKKVNLDQEPLPHPCVFSMIPRPPGQLEFSSQGWTTEAIKSQMPPASKLLFRYCLPEHVEYRLVFVGGRLHHMTCFTQMLDSLHPPMSATPEWTIDANTTLNEWHKQVVDACKAFLRGLAAIENPFNNRRGSDLFATMQIGVTAQNIGSMWVKSIGRSFSGCIMSGNDEMMIEAMKDLAKAVPGWVYPEKGHLLKML
jgi:hypothetical protein